MSTLAESYQWWNYTRYTIQLESDFIFVTGRYRVIGVKDSHLCALIQQQQKEFFDRQAGRRAEFIRKFFLTKKDPDKTNEPKDAKTHITKKLSKIWPKCNFN